MAAMVPNPAILEQRIGPQPGPQELFLRKRWVDLIVYGGAAGGGKSWGLLLDAGWHAFTQPVAGYGAVIFRREMTDVTQTGGLWETSQGIYPLVGGKPRQSPWLGWEWPQLRTTIRFGHLEHEKDKLGWQGAQLDWCGFDELTHFTESQFFYLLSRVRSTVGVKPVMRATTNPDPESWVKHFLAPWVDDEYSDPAASGEVRYFYREGDDIIWMRSPAQRPEWIERDHVYSVTFIQAHLEDNPALLKADPGYRGRLHAMPLLERTILLGGPQAWKIRKSGNKFKRHWFSIIPVEQVPAKLEAVVRRWDLAATEPKPGKDPDYTVGLKMGMSKGRYYVLDVVRDRLSPRGVEQLVLHTAQRDGLDVAIYMEQEPGSSGKKVITDYRELLADYDFHGIPASGDKELRANPFSSQAEGGNVYLVEAQWNDAYLNELSAFPDPKYHDDQVDGSSGAYRDLRSGGVAIASGGGSSNDNTAAGMPEGANPLQAFLSARSSGQQGESVDGATPLGDGGGEDAEADTVARARMEQAERLQRVLGQLGGGQLPI